MFFDAVYSFIRHLMLPVFIFLSPTSARYHVSIDILSAICQRSRMQYFSDSQLSLLLLLHYSERNGLTIGLISNLSLNAV